jgi:hypothetical protein
VRLVGVLGLLESPHSAAAGNVHQLVRDAGFGVDSRQSGRRVLREDRVMLF